MTPADGAALPPLVLPAGIWRQLADGRPDTATLRLLRTARGHRNLLLLRALHERRRGTPAWDTAVHVLAGARRRAPGAFASLVADPAAGAWLAHAARTGGVDTADADAAADAAVTALAAAAGHRARGPFRVTVPVRQGVVVLPGLGAARLPDAVTTACVERAADGTWVRSPGAGVRVPDRPESRAPGWTPLPRLRLRAPVRETTVLLDSLSPLRLGAPARPPSTMAPSQRRAWHTRLGAAWRLLAAHHPDQAAAVAGTIGTVVPLEAEPRSAGGGGHWVSASFGDAVGAAALAPLDDPVELAAALIHEAQHSLLYALLDLTRLLDQPTGLRVYAPWSDEPRPPSGLLQGAFAFFGTAAFWRRETLRGNTRAQKPYLRWRLRAQTALAALTASPWPTRDGRRLLDAMAGVPESWSDPPVDPAVLAGELAVAAEHRVRWRLRHSWADPGTAGALAAALSAGRDLPPPSDGACHLAPDRVEYPPGPAALADGADRDCACEGAGPHDWARLAGLVVRAADDSARALIAVPELVRDVHAGVAARAGVPLSPLAVARRLRPWAG